MIRPSRGWGPARRPEPATLFAGPLDGVEVDVDLDVLAATLATPDGPVRYVRTIVDDAAGRAVFVDARVANPAALDRRLR